MISVSAIGNTLWACVPRLVSYALEQAERLISHAKANKEDFYISWRAKWSSISSNEENRQVYHQQHIQHNSFNIHRFQIGSYRVFFIEGQIRISCKMLNITGIYCSRMRVHLGVEEVHPCGKKWKLYFAKEQFLQCNFKSTS